MTIVNIYIISVLDTMEGTFAVTDMSVEASDILSQMSGTET